MKLELFDYIIIAVLAVLTVMILNNYYCSESFESVQSQSKNEQTYTEAISKTKEYMRQYDSFSRGGYSLLDQLLNNPSLANNEGFVQRVRQGKEGLDFNRQRLLDSYNTMIEYSSIVVREQKEKNQSDKAEHGRYVKMLRQECKEQLDEKQISTELPTQTTPDLPNLPISPDMPDLPFPIEIPDISSQMDSSLDVSDISESTDISSDKTGPSHDLAKLGPPGIAVS